MEAREHAAFVSPLSGVVMTISACTSEHSLEHAMSGLFTFDRVPLSDDECVAIFEKSYR